MIDRLKNLHKEENRKLLIIVVILLSIPITLWLALQSVRYRSRAATVATLSIEPTSQTRAVGEAGTADVFLNPNGEQVAGVELAINFDPTVVQVDDIAPGNFFTSYSGGSPVEVVESIDNTTGEIHYAVAFPLGSDHSSTTADTAAVISFTALADGTSNLTFQKDPSINPYTFVTDINNLNVFDPTYDGDGSVMVGSTTSKSARLYFSAPRPSNPQTVNTSFDIDVMMDTGGQDVDGVDARMNFSPSELNVVSIQQVSGNGLPSYPLVDFDNAAGTIKVSANIGSGSTATPVNGSSIVVGTITINPVVATTGTQILYDFVAGERNDSNVVLSGTLSSGDPVDILGSVSEATITAESSVAPSPTPTPVADSSTNHALNETVTASTSIEDWGWGRQYAVDGNRDSISGALGWTSDGGSTTEWITVDMGQSITINRVDLYPRNDGSYTGWGFPEDFSIQVSGDGSSWSTVVSHVGYPMPTNGGVQSFAFSDVSARYVRVYGTKFDSGGAPHMQFAEIEIYGDGTATTASPTPTSSTDPTATPTGSETTQSVSFTLAFQGRVRSGVDRTRAVEISYRDLSDGTITTVNPSTDANGVASVSIAPGQYEILVDSQGYLAKKYGDSTSPVTIEDGQISVILSPPLLGGDLNDDGTVNSFDYSAFLPAFLSSDATIDLDGSGEVNNLDFGIIRSNWGLSNQTL